MLANSNVWCVTICMTRFEVDAEVELELQILVCRYLNYVFFVLEVPLNGPQLQTFGVHFFVLKVLPRWTCNFKPLVCQFI